MQSCAAVRSLGFACFRVAAGVQGASGAVGDVQAMVMPALACKPKLSSSAEFSFDLTQLSNLSAQHEGLHGLGVSPACWLLFNAQLVRS